MFLKQPLTKTMFERYKKLQLLAKYIVQNYRQDQDTINNGKQAKIWDDHNDKFCVCCKLHQANQEYSLYIIINIISKLL